MGKEKNIVQIIEKEITNIINEKIQSSNSADEKNYWENKKWDNFFVKKQIDKRDKGIKFTLSDHIQAMVYSFLSSQNEWDKIERNKNKIDLLFCEYDADKLLKNDSIDLANGIIGGDIKCGTQSTKKQMIALKDNIVTLQRFSDIDAMYQLEIESNGYVGLIKKLSLQGSNWKLKQMGIPLVSEYLRNIGYDIPKPDRHIIRFLGPEVLEEHTYKKISNTVIWKCFDIIEKYSKKTGYRQAYIDYLFWTYCANKYGEICTKQNAKCSRCKLIRYCKHEH